MAQNTSQVMRLNPPTSLRERVQQHPLVSFFILAYAIPTVAYATYVAFPTLPYDISWFFGVFSPTISAVIIGGLIGGLPEIKRLFSGFTRWRVGWKWYLAAASFMLSALVLALGYITLGNPPRGLSPEMTVGAFLGALVFTLLSGPLSEEAGWRGFALPRMEARHSALTASVLLGVLWAFWHVPQYWLLNMGGIPFAAFVPITICLSILFTWMYNNTGGSLVITVLAHFSFNFAGGFIAGHMGLLPPMVLYIGGGIAIVVYVVVVVLWAGWKNLSRKPLSELPFHRVEQP